MTLSKIIKRLFHNKYSPSSSTTPSKTINAQKNLNQMITALQKACEKQDLSALNNLIIQEALPYMQRCLQQYSSKSEEYNFVSILNKTKISKKISSEMKEIKHMLNDNDPNKIYWLNLFVQLCAHELRVKDDRTDNGIRLFAFQNQLRNLALQKYRYHDIDRPDLTFLDNKPGRPHQSPYGKPLKPDKQYALHIPSGFLCEMGLRYFSADRQKDAVPILNVMEKKAYKVRIREGRLYRGPRDSTQSMEQGTYLYIISPKGGLYAIEPTNKISIENQDLSSPHHSTPRGGQPILCAGDITVNNTGAICEINNASGHYRPSNEHLAVSILYLHQEGILKNLDCNIEFCAKDYNLTNQRIKKVTLSNFLESPEYASLREQANWVLSLKKRDQSFLPESPSSSLRR